MTREEMQKNFERICARQMQELEMQQKTNILESLMFYISDSLNETDCAKNNLLIDPPNIEKIYEMLDFACISLKCAIEELEELKQLIN